MSVRFAFAAKAQGGTTTATLVGQRQHTNGCEYQHVMLSLLAGLHSSRRPSSRQQLQQPPVPAAMQPPSATQPLLRPLACWQWACLVLRSLLLLHHQHQHRAALAWRSCTRR